METKLIEVRDIGTRVEVLAIRLGSTNEAEQFILASAGYGRGPWEFSTYVLLIDLNTPLRIWLNSTECDMAHRMTRTYPITHKELEDHWDKYQSGDVLDVQFVLGETTEPKKSDRFWDLTDSNLP